jgi:mRNA interferase MazF
MTGYKRGDIVLVWFPNSDLRTYKKRPALVVQREDLRTGLSQVVLAMITTNMSRLGHPSRVVLKRTHYNRLLHDSVVMADNLITALEKLIIRVWGEVDDMTQVNAALRYALDL